MADVLIDPIDHAAQEAFEQAEWDRLEAEDLDKPGRSLADVLTTDADGAPPKLGLEADAPNAGDPPAELSEPAAGKAASPSPSAAAPVAAPPDPMAEMNAAIARLSAQMEANLRAINGKVGGLQSTIQSMRSVQAEAAVAKAAPATANGPSQQQIAAAAKDPVKWKALKEDFSDWGEGVEEYVEMRLQGLQIPQAIDVNALKQELTQTVQQTFQQQRKQELVEQEVARTIEAVHPGWQAEINTDTFITWQSAQARGIRALADSPDPEDAIALLNLYRKDHPAAADPVVEQAAPDADQIAAQRRQRLAASATPSKAIDPGPRSGVTLDDMTDDQYWAYLDRQEAQKRARA